MKSTNKTKLTARMMLLVLLLASMVTLASCGIFSNYWELYSHKEFVRKVEEYNSRHNLYVDTFISFDLDSNEEISSTIYYFIAGTPKQMSNKILYDIDDKPYHITQVFYLDKLAYKITCKYGRLPNNFTAEDKIEIKSCKTHFACEGGDQYYRSSLVTQSDYENAVNGKFGIYEYVYRYEIYINDVDSGCIHISSIEEASEEKLAEIIQMMQDSLVVLNTEELFIWRGNK